MYKRLICLIIGCMLLLAPAASGGLVGWWKLDEGAGTTVRDSSGSGIDGTIRGKAQWVTGVLGGALEFDGSSSVDFGTAPKLQLTEAITIACWVNPAGLAGEQGFAGRDGGYAFKGHGTGVRFTTPGILDHSTTNLTLRVGEWQHIAAAFKPGQSGGLAFYLNGVETDRMTSSNINVGTGPFRIGTNQWSEAYTGMIDDVRVYDRLLSAGHMKDLYNGIDPSFAKAEKPNPADGATGVTMPLLQWSPGDNAKLHNVFLGTSADLTAADQVASRQPFTMVYVTKGLLPGTTYYWRVDEIEADGVTTHTGDIWTFATAPLTAYNPNPRNGDKWIATDATLTWVPGQAAVSHDLYFGTDKDAVSNRDAATSKGKLAAATYSPEGLNQGTTYYWVIDEITGTGKNAGEVWSFTVTSGGGGAKGEYFNGMTVTGVPALTRIDPVIDFSWGDPGGPGAPIGVDQFSARWTADLEIVIADTYTFITNTDDGARLWLNDKLIVNQWVDQGATDAPSKPIALQPGIYPLRMEYYENTGGAVARLFWQSPSLARQIIPAGPLQPPVRARALYPASGDVNVPQELTLLWSAGEEALQHQVYFGEDANAVANATTDSSGIYKGQQAVEATSFNAGSLEWNKTYYWRVDEVNDASADSPWKGSVWSFTTANFIVVDDFESYNDEADKGTRLYETWIDGLTNGTTATVGNWDPPFAEQTIVHSGKQSMPMDYNNVNSPYYAEAEREFSPLQNWKVNDVTDLSLWFRGQPISFVETAPDSITMTSTSGDVWDVVDHFRFVFKRLNGDGTIVARVDSMTNTAAWAKAGVMIRESLEVGSTHAFEMVAPNGRTAFQNRQFTNELSYSAHGNVGMVTFPHWIKLERKGNQFTAYHSSDGVQWTLQANEGGGGGPNPQTINMSGLVYIGLMVTSNNLTTACQAEFTNIKTTGNVSGSWQAADVGPAIPGNNVDALYVVVEDSAGKAAVVTHPDALAVTVTDWTEWKIPLSELAGVNLAKVKKLYIGVGDRGNPAADGKGRIFIDDIRVVKP